MAWRQECLDEQDAVHRLCMQSSTTAGNVALFLLVVGGAVDSVLGGFLADRYDRVRVSRWSYLIAAVTAVIYTPGPAVFLFVASPLPACTSPIHTVVLDGHRGEGRRGGVADGGGVSRRGARCLDHLCRDLRAEQGSRSASGRAEPC
ncbi:hypothetical protein [Streptomyces griseoluteus]|uniref:hypothetical protein n=1 Tax=Streptomyces griseoluteus TaxID=29306 RepID=UPI0036FB3D07